MCFFQNKTKHEGSVISLESDVYAEHVYAEHCMPVQNGMIDTGYEENNNVISEDKVFYVKVIMSVYSIVMQCHKTSLDLQPNSFEEQYLKPLYDPIALHKC